MIDLQTKTNLGEELLTRLQNIAKKKGTSVNNLVSNMCTYSLEEYEKLQKAGR